jgi:Ca2+-binding RTX toxin-like protein
LPDVPPPIGLPSSCTVGGVEAMAIKFRFTWDEDAAKVPPNLLYRGTQKDDTFHGKGGNDTISGDDGNDKLYGDKGADGIYGQKDNDKLYGEAGIDKLDGGTGTDQLRGGADKDTFVFSTKYDKDTIFDFQPDDIFNHDVIDLSNLKSIDDYDDLVENHMTLAGNGKDVIINGGGGDVLVIKNVTLEALDASHFLIF